MRPLISAAAIELFDQQMAREKSFFTPQQKAFLLDFFPSFAKTAPRSPEREAWLDNLCEAWQGRWTLTRDYRRVCHPLDC